MPITSSEPTPTKMRSLSTPYRAASASTRQEEEGSGYFRNASGSITLRAFATPGAGG